MFNFFHLNIILLIKMNIILLNRINLFRIIIPVAEIEIALYFEYNRWAST
jgi:hypothetical protein